MAAFSRLQLAAALLEYDNDPTNPDAPKRSAYDSAIFLHIRPKNLNNLRGRKPDHLGVAFPSEAASQGGRESILETGRRISVDALRNPFSAEDNADSLDDDDEDLEVDLASWGLDSFIPKDKGSKARKKSKQAAVPNSHPVASFRQRPAANIDVGDRRGAGTRSISFGEMDVGPDGMAGVSQSLSIGSDARRRSVGSMLDMTRRDTLQPSQRPASSYALIQNMPESSSGPSIPFPTSARPDSQSIHEGDLAVVQHRRERSGSISSLEEKEDTKETDNPFAIRPPSRQRASRFDPKANHDRTMSNATTGMRNEDNQLRPSSRASKLDHHGRQRSMSNGSGDSHHGLDDDGVSIVSGGQNIPDRPYSTLDLLRPKVLVMPSPLQTRIRPPTPPPVASREGFQISVDGGTPLPPGARAIRRNSSNLLPTLDQEVPVAANSFIPNPRMSLSLSQLTFRNTLLVGGERDVAYTDIDRTLPRATREGEQIRSGSPVDDPPAPEVVEEPTKTGRQPGKLFGKSLIDDLEMRKAQMRGRQRVFTGDQRPSMMARTLQRSSTLIDPATLHARPISQHLGALGSPGPQQGLARRASATMKPYLTFDDDENLPKTNAGPERVINGRSVFGVDTLWEREMAKLREIEAAEKLEAEAEGKKQREAEEKAERRKKGKGKGKGKENDSAGVQPVSASTRISEEPPTLPTIQKAKRRAPPPPDDDDDDEEEEESEGSDEGLAKGPPLSLSDSRDAGVEGWYAGSSDEEDIKPQRTTGVGPRYKKVSRARQADDDSEEDLPLSLTVERVVQRAHGQGRSGDDSDDEGQPLSVLLEKTKMSLSSSHDGSIPDAKPKDADADDDDLPLGLRASTFLSLPQASAAVEDDDRPLAFHPEQQRRTQYKMLAHQQQQQQMLMQAQLHNSMFFNPPPVMMAPGYFGQTMAPPIMMPPPIPMPSPPPMHDAAKFGRVDRWRRDVVVERES